MAFPGQKEASSIPRLKPDWLSLVRMVIIITMLFSMSAYVIGLVYYFQRLIIPSDQAVAGSSMTISQMHQYMTELGLPVAAYAWFNVILMGALGVGYVGVALLLLWYKPKDRMAIFTALILTVFGTGFAPVIEFVADSFPNLSPLLNAWSAAAFALLFILYLTFPDGRFAPRWTAAVAVFWVLENTISFFWPGSFLALYDYPDPWGISFVFMTLGIFIYAQVYRYYFVSDPLQRQQTRWVVIGLLSTVIVFPIPWTFFLIWPQAVENTSFSLVSDVLTTLIYGFAFLQIPITIGVAVSRYHLWDIDVLLRRTVIYTLLTAILAGIYLFAVIVLQFILDRIFQAGDSPLITVISTLAIAALFNPLRRQIQSGIDTRFYRRKQDAVRALATFHARLQHDVDLNSLTKALNQVVVDSIQPQSLTVWIRPDRMNSSTNLKNAPGSHAEDAFRNDFETPTR